MTPPLIVVGGVAGCGKTTLAAAIAAAAGLPFRDGDELHPPANVAKMAAGNPLTDADRAPWLAACAAQLAAWGAAGSGGVISASALKRQYRDTLYAAHPSVRYVLISITPALAVIRAKARTKSGSGHFWPAALTASQFAILELPAPDEGAVVVAANWPTPRQVGAVLSDLNQLR
ncbi:gluconokinase, GntK/IdnK-type [Sandarakinorhabdus sp.]|uniref:gluconokinase n=1 Tax=Sandarakinorhabdus sp. TaxID=1916663 RepID=UPI00286E793F|nr:gluconokinase, GntK/IdnK-type [Sandarakinorhabdus sp.]